MAVPIGKMMNDFSLEISCNQHFLSIFPTFSQHFLRFFHGFPGVSRGFPAFLSLEAQVKATVDATSKDLGLNSDKVVSAAGAMERSTIFNGKIHYFYGHFPLLC